jgi:hypothetical protein
VSPGVAVLFAAGDGIGLFIGGGAPTGRVGVGAAAGATLPPGKMAPGGILSIGTFTYCVPSITKTEFGRCGGTGAVLVAGFLVESCRARAAANVRRSAACASFTLKYFL